jgi:hypothetical protein
LLLLTLRGVSNVSFVLAAERVLSPRLVASDTCAQEEQANDADMNKRIAVLRANENEPCFLVEHEQAWVVSALKKRERIAIVSPKGVLSSTNHAEGAGRCDRGDKDKNMSPGMTMHVVVHRKPFRHNPTDRVDMQCVAHLANNLRIIPDSRSARPARIWVDFS